MRVLFVCATDFRVASEKQALAFAQALASRGHPVLMTLTGDPVTAEAEGATGVPGLEVRGHRFRGRRLRRDDLEAVARFSPDVIHAFSARTSVISAVRSLRSVTQAPVVVHWEDDEWRIRDDDMDRPPIRRLARRARRVVAAVAPAQGPFVTRSSLRWVAAHAAAHEALTPALAEHVGGRLGRSVEVVRPITPPAPDTPAPRRLPPELTAVPVVLWTGTVHPASAADFRLALAAVAELRRRGRDVALVHAGEVLARYDRTAWAREAGLPDDRVRYLGYVPYPQLPALLREATVLLQSGAPSEYNRLRLPSKLQAYLASGVPTVSFAVGFGEQLADRDEALLTRTGSSAELADRLQEAIADEPLRARLAAGGPEAAHRLFDPERNVEALLAVYRRVAAA